MDIPVFHDDQHGTAIIVAAGLINACHLRGKEMSKVRVVFNGAGAAGIACLQMVLDAGVDKVRYIYIRFDVFILYSEPYFQLSKYSFFLLKILFVLPRQK